jgi:hypothetical protein
MDRECAGPCSTNAQGIGRSAGRMTYLFPTKQEEQHPPAPAGVIINPAERMTSVVPVIVLPVSISGSPIGLHGSVTRNTFVRVSPDY